ncbi:MAG TPA: cytochrome c oxidase assembly protein [Acidimicrobiales bacterium]|nr:cytochrome c oxidase assembly protein [Acidimicrobiales bacterium]
MTVPIEARTLVLDWQIPPVAGTVLIGGAVGYGWGVARLRRRGRNWPATRTGPFCAGLAVIAIALCSGLARYDTTVFSLHMLQHLVLAMVGPPLLALGAPVTLALQAGSRDTQRRLLRVLHSPPVVVLTHPLTAWGLMGASLVALYFTPLYALSLRHASVHDLVHLQFVLVGVVFIWPVVGLDPMRWRLPHGARLLYVLTALPFHSIVGLALVSSTAPTWAAHTLADQQAGGGVMMLGGDLVTLVMFVVVFMQWSQAEQRAALRADAASGRHDVPRLSNVPPTNPSDRSTIPGNDDHNPNTNPTPVRAAPPASTNGHTLASGNEPTTPVSSSIAASSRSDGRGAIIRLRRSR